MEGPRGELKLLANNCVSELWVALQLQSSLQSTIPSQSMTVTLWEILEQEQSSYDAVGFQTLRKSEIIHE